MKILTGIYIFILAVIIFLADFRNTNYFAFVASIPSGDKIGHFCLAGMFSLLVNFALRAKSFRFWKIDFLLGSLIVLLLTTVEEFSQIFIRGRTFDWGDLIFDYAGIVIFGEAARFIDCRITRRGNFYQKAPRVYW